MAFAEWIKANRAKKLSEFIEQVNAKLRGHYQYFGVIGNSAGIAAYRYHVVRLIFKWLNRRSQKRSMTWAEFNVRIAGKLTSPKIAERRVLQRKLFGNVGNHWAGRILLNRSVESLASWFQVREQAVASTLR